MNVQKILQLRKREEKTVKEKITVLIADDNQEFSKTLATYLGNEKDMEVVGMAKDGVEAVEQIKELLPDVAILDVIMPHLDGLGVLEKINNSNMVKTPICIILSIKYAVIKSFPDTVSLRTRFFCMRLWPFHSPFPLPACLRNPGTGS